MFFIAHRQPARSYDMASFTKMTILSNSLLQDALKIARRVNATLRALMTLGLRPVLADRRERTAFRLRRATYRGKGQQPALSGASWERIRDWTYQGRGGVA